MPEPRSSESPKSPSWSEWKARNGSKLWCWRAPLAVEWALEWFVYGLRGLALFELLELAGKLTVVVAVVFWFLEADDRAKERHYRAWELINSARGSAADGGRRDALEDLNKDGVSLAGAPLENAYLLGINLKQANLKRTNLQDAQLLDADLQGANLNEANLCKSNLQGANLQGANLRKANLEHAYLEDAFLQSADLAAADMQGTALWGVNLQDATLWLANLKNADLRNANLRDANMVRANLRGAFLLRANLHRADLGLANLQDANLQQADLRGATNLTQEQLDAAIGDDSTQLPEGLTRSARWVKGEQHQDPAPPQPDDIQRHPPWACASGSGK